MKIEYNDIKDFPFTLKQIKYFIAVVEYKKVTVAAKYIFISPSVITTAIKDLETHLQVNLFKRTNDGLKLTREGDIFLNHCYDILSVVSSAHNATRNLTTYKKNTLAGTLKVGCTETISGYLLSKILVSFRQHFPNVILSIKEFSRKNLEKNVINGNLDIALALTDNLQYIDNLYYEILMGSLRNLWVSDNHKFLRQDVVTLEDVAKQPFIQLTLDEAKTTNLKYWARFNLKPNIVFESNSVESIRSMVSIGQGVTILSDMVYRPWSLDGKRIERIKLMNPTKNMNIGLVWSKNHIKSKQMEEFISICQRQTARL